MVCYNYNTLSFNMSFHSQILNIQKIQTNELKLFFLFPINYYIHLTDTVSNNYLKSINMIIYTNSMFLLKY